jgi:hypothetical protein
MQANPEQLRDYRDYIKRLDNDAIRNEEHWQSYFCQADDEEFHRGLLIVVHHEMLDRNILPEHEVPGNDPCPEPIVELARFGL